MASSNSLAQDGLPIEGAISSRSPKLPEITQKMHFVSESEKKFRWKNVKNYLEPLDIASNIHGRIITIVVLVVKHRFLLNRSLN